jgi:thioredoxin 1
MPDQPIVKVTESSFDADVLASPLPVLLDFWAPWCAPCVALMPAVESTAALYAGRVKFAKINVDEAPAMRERFGIRGIPHLVLMKNGEQAAVVRARTKTRLVIELDALLGSEHPR